MTRRAGQTLRPPRNALRRLRRFWRAFEPVSLPYLHPQDKQYLDRFVTLNYGEYQQRIGEIDAGEIHAGLLPSPFKGNLSRADVFILMLNPGFHPINYYAEKRDRGLRAALLRELHQRLSGQEYPFTFLNPKFCYYSGFTYWENRLKKVLEAVSEGRGMPYRRALRFVSRRLAVVQLLPYHSKEFRHGRLLHALPSVATARDFAAELHERAKRDEITVVVARRSKSWGIRKSDESNRVIVYGGSEARGGHLNDRAVGAIRRRWEL